MNSTISIKGSSIEYHSRFPSMIIQRAENRIIFKTLHFISLLTENRLD